MRTFWLAVFLLMSGVGSWASDHDDGEMDLKGRSLNITDVYVFREDNQTGNPADNRNLILVMNTNPRSLPGQQYFFSTQAQYTFHLSRVAASQKAVRPTGSDDVKIHLMFGSPDENGRQPVTLILDDGTALGFNKTETGHAILTTNIADSKEDRLTHNVISIGGERVTVFAGLREDPFFFDVEQFFKVRATALATRTFAGWLPADKAKDFTHNHNVNTIVVRIPITLLQKSGETVFDVWTTISVLK